MSNRRQSVASQLQSERDCRRWAGWMNGRLEGAIAAAELAAIGAEEFAARLRSGVVLWMLLETFADPKELLPAGRQAPRGLREGRRRHREPSRIEAVDNLNCVFGALARLGVNHTGIGPLDVADAKTELVLGLVWSIVAHVVASAARAALGARERRGVAAERGDDRAAAVAGPGRRGAGGARRPRRPRVGAQRTRSAAGASRPSSTPTTPTSTSGASSPTSRSSRSASRRSAAAPRSRRRPRRGSSEAAGPWEAVLGGWRDRARRAADLAERSSGASFGGAYAEAARQRRLRGRPSAALDNLPAAATAGDVWDGLRRDAALVKAVAAAAANASRRAVAADEAARTLPPPPPPPPPGTAAAWALLRARHAELAESDNGALLAEEEASPRPRRPRRGAAPRPPSGGAQRREDRDAAVAAAAARGFLDASLDGAKARDAAVRDALAERDAAVTSKVVAAA
ncbi:sodium solute symporter [Aureococcus anophagefferens]|nr:sodium solute symporter [Aureococcus anophagefferens]